MSKHLKTRGQNKKLRKRLIIFSVTAALLTAGVLGAWFFIQHQNDQKTIEVQPVSNQSTTYWGDESNSSGTILSDYVQEISPSADQIITDIFVTEGQEVHIGDPLLQYDRTKFELDVEAKDLAVKQAELKVEEAQKQLKKLQNTKPAATPRPTARPTRTPAPTRTPRPTATPTPVPSQSPTPIPPADVTLYSRLDLDSLPYMGSGTTEDPYVFLCADGCIMTKEFLAWLLGVQLEPEDPDNPDVSEDPDDPDSSELEPLSSLPSPFAAVFEVREGNSNYGKVISSFTLDGTQLSGKILAEGLLETTNTVEVAERVFAATPTPSPTPNSNNYNDMGYTSAQLKEMIAEKRQEIRDLQYALKQAKLNLEISRRALDNSTVVSNVDGQVRSLLDLDTAVTEGKPLLVVSGEDTFYVSGVLSEGLLGSVNIGDMITVTSWMNGMTYMAQIVNISDFPLESSSSYYGAGNPNSSTYEFTAVINEPDDTLENGMYVEITLSVRSDEEDTQAMYLYKPYLREDEGGYYVMMAGKDNRLVKQYVQIGKTIYGGDYYEIVSGLTNEDFIAFPYGTDTKEGVRVVLQGSGELPYPEDGDEMDPGSSGFESLLTEAGMEDLPLAYRLLASVLEGVTVGSGGSTPAPDDGIEGPAGNAGLPDGAVITGRDQNGTYFETEDGGGVILD